MKKSTRRRQAGRARGDLELPSWWRYMPDAARQWAREAERRLADGQGIPVELTEGVRLALRDLTADRPERGRGRPSKGEVHFWLACYHWHNYRTDGLKKQAALATLDAARRCGIRSPASEGKLVEIAEKLKQPAAEFLARTLCEITERIAREGLDVEPAAYHDVITSFIENRLAQAASRK